MLQLLKRCKKLICLVLVLGAFNIALAKNKFPCFLISHINLIGDSAKYFQFALKPVIKGDHAVLGKCLGANEINQVLSRVQNNILEKGYSTTRVLVAPQNIKSGKLNLMVIPGRIKKINFMNQDSHLSSMKWNALPIRQGDILNLFDLEQGLENFKRVPTAEADIQIKPTDSNHEKPGESELLIRYQQGFPLRLTFSVDDSGAKQTGKYQGALTVSYDSPFKLNDLFYLNLNHDLRGGNSSQYGTKGYALYYSIPFHYWKITANTNRYHFKQTVAGSNQSYVYSGENKNVEMILSRIIYRNATTKSALLLGAYFKNAHNFIEDTEIEIQRRRSGGWKPSFWWQKFIGMATLDISLAYQLGTKTFGFLLVPEEKFNEGTSFPHIFTTDISLNFPFKINEKKFRYHTLWRGQWTNKALIPQDRFAIGGRYSVRGFDGVNTLLGEVGWLSQNDIGLIVGKTQQEFYLGADYGQVSGPSSHLLLGKQLAGVVTGVRGAYKGFHYDLFLGWPVDKPPGFKTARTTGGFNVSWSS